MDAQFNHEFLLMQQSRCNQKYADLVEEIQQIPIKLNQSYAQPMGKFGRRISKLVKNRGKMLMLLDKRVSKFFRK